MARGGSVDFKELKKLQRKLQRLEDSQLDKFLKDSSLTKRLVLAIMELSQKWIAKSPVKDPNHWRLSIYTV